MSLYKTLKTNPDLETQGVWKELPRNEDGTIPRFLLARAAHTNVAYQKKMEQWALKNRMELSMNLLSDETVRAPMIEIFASTVLLNWENIRDETEREMAFTYENAVKILTDIPDLYNILKEFSENLSNYQYKTIEGKLGNSQPLSLERSEIGHI